MSVMCLKNPNPGEFYKDRANQLCQIIAIAKDKKRNLDMVVYQELYGCFLSYTLEKEDFFNEYERVVPVIPDVKETNPSIKKNENEGMVRVDEENVDAQEKFQASKAMDGHKEDVEKRFMAFLDAESSREKLEILHLLHNDLDLRLVNNIAASMDLPADEEDTEKQYEFFVQNLKQRIKFECDRFRK